MHCKVDANIVAALRSLYRGMTAQVALWPGMNSRDLRVERGVRQGDPLSSLLFNLVLNEVLREVQVVWHKRGYGTNVGMSLSGHRLTDVAFADDMTIVARIWLSMKRMLRMLREALSKRGLTLHPTKCKVQTNITDFAQRGMIQLDDGSSVKFLLNDTWIKVLGTILSLTDATKVEVTNRMASGWRSFWSLKRMLLNRRVSVHRRLKLFDATVGSCVLCGM